jgi:hypothetical protein
MCVFLSSDVYFVDGTLLTYGLLVLSTRSCSIGWYVCVWTHNPWIWLHMGNPTARHVPHTLSHSLQYGLYRLKRKPLYGYIGAVPERVGRTVQIISPKHVSFSNAEHQNYNLTVITAHVAIQQVRILIWKSYFFLAFFHSFFSRAKTYNLL